MRIHKLERFPWLAYFVERVNPLTTLPLIIGFSLSAGLVTKGYVELFSFLISSLLLFFIACYLRLRNDFDDYEKDCIAFGDRPLPRSLISRRDVQEGLQYQEYILASFLGIIFIFFPTETKLNVLLVGGYLWLMGHKFYLPQWQKRSPLFKEILNQGFVIPLTLLIIAIYSPPNTFTWISLSYTLVVFGAVFLNNLCRKLDPYAHPASLSFIHYYGFHFSYYIALIALFLSAVGAYGLGAGLWLWPCELGVLYLLSRLFKNPKEFHFVQIAALFSLFMHVCSGVLITTLA